MTYFAALFRYLPRTKRSRDKLWSSELLNRDLNPEPFEQRYETVVVVAHLQRLPESVQGCMHECDVFSCKSAYTWWVQLLRSPKEAFAAAMQSWRERCETCVCLQGDYVEK